MKKFNWIGAAWYIDFLDSLRTKEGWHLFGKLLIFLFTLLGGVVALASFYSSNLESSLERAEKSYYSFLDNFSGSKRENRMGATFEIPAILSKKVPRDSHVSLLNAVSYLFGASKETVPLYQEKVKKLLFDRIRSFTEDNPDWSQKEMEELIATLLKIDSSGWYTATRSGLEENVPRSRNKFNWIWRGGPPAAITSYALSTIFTGVKLDGISFSNNDFAYPDFQRSSIKNCDFKYSTIVGGMFRLCRGDSLKVSWAKITRSDFTSVRFPYASFYNCLIRDCSFRTSADGDTPIPGNLSNTSFQGDSIINVSFENAMMDSTTFVNAAIVNCNFYGSNMCNADLSNLKALQNTKFEFSDLRNIKFNNNSIIRVTFKSANLVGASFSNSRIKDCIFDRANLAGVDFTGSSLNDSLTTWKDANIAGAKGLSQQQRHFLLSKGAVSISDKINWNKYMKEGAPSKEWIKYTTEQDEK